MVQQDNELEKGAKLRKLEQIIPKVMDNISRQERKRDVLLAEEARIEAMMARLEEDALKA